MRDPLVLPFVALAAGVLAAGALHFSAPEASLPMLAMLLLWIAAQLAGISRWLRWLCALVAIFFAGAWNQVAHRPGPPPEIDAGPRETMILAGCVVEPTALSPDREQFTVELDPGARARVTLVLPNQQSTDGGALVSPRLEYGQRVELDARLRSPHNFNNPGGFDYAGYLARQDIFWLATMARNSQPRILPGRCGSLARAGLFRLRGALLERIESLYSGDEYLTGMMEAILIGENSRLERIWTENFRRTGTFHALVISGAHIAVLALVLTILFRLLGVPEIPSLTITAMVAWLYALVSGFSAPVGRAAVGFTLYLGARFLFRQGRVLNLLAAVAILFVLFDPQQLTDASFHLSFLSVAAIGALAAPFRESTTGPYADGLRGLTNVDVDPHLPPKVAQFRVELRLVAEAVSLWTKLKQAWILATFSRALRLLAFAWDMLVISAMIQVGLALPMALYFHRISFTGLSANLLVVPLLEATVPLGFLAVFTGFRWVAALAGWLLRLAAEIADWHAKVEPFWRISAPPLWLALALPLALVWLALAFRSRLWRWPAAVATAGLFGLMLWQPWAAQIRPNALELTAIDVGQGDSLLVSFPDKSLMLIDGGGVLSYGRDQKPRLDTGEDVVSSYLWSRGIRRLNIVAVTHAHEDHMGGIASVLRNFHPQELWVGAHPSPELLALAEELKIAVKRPAAPGSLSYGGTDIQVLSPFPDHPFNEGNNDSLVLRIAYGQRAMLLTGDIEKPIEDWLLSLSESLPVAAQDLTAKNPPAESPESAVLPEDIPSGQTNRNQVLRADILKVAHHGSRTSTSEAFLAAVSPSVVAVSAGFQNSFGHPNRAVLERLEERHIPVLRTDLDGLVTIGTDGKRVWFDKKVWHPGQGDFGFSWAEAEGR